MPGRGPRCRLYRPLAARNRLPLRDLIGLGLIGMIFLIQYLDQFIPKDALLGLAFILAGVGK